MTYPVKITVTIKEKNAIPEVELSDWKDLRPRDFERVAKYSLRKWKEAKGHALNEQKKADREAQKEAAMEAEEVMDERHEEHDEDEEDDEE